MKILNSAARVNMCNLSKNAETSVDQVERFYARFLPLPKEMANNPENFEVMREMTRGSFFLISVYALIYIVASVAFTTYRHIEGYYWLNGFLFISYDYFTIACFAIISISVWNIFLFLWGVGCAINASCQSYILILISGMLMCVAQYGVSLISMRASIHILRVCKFDSVFGCVS